ncbi:MAG: 23S rRNA (uracil(1939)-C(5))-methyltransferase RlmD [Eubacteriales bacterium]
MVRKNETHTVEITGYTAEGAGVARIDGQAIFVKDVIVGEVAQIKIDHVGKRFAYGTLIQLETVSPNRVNRLCTIGKRCGGCDFWHMNYREELRLKSNRVCEALNRIGGQSLENVEITGAETMLAYRNKAQFPVTKGKNGVEAGFYQAGTHKVIPVEKCLIQPDVTAQVEKIAVQWMRRWNIPAYNEEKHVGCVRHIYVRTAQKTGDVLLCIVTLGEQMPKAQDLVERLQADVPSIRTVVQVIQPKKTNVILGDEVRVIFGDGFIEEELCGNTFRVSAKSFFQINRDQAERLYEKALEYAQLTKEDTALDLYCGAGTITLAMAKEAGQVIGVEVVEPAILDARVNAENNGVDNVKFICADAGEAAQKLAADEIQPKVIVVDPPRKGLSPDVIQAIATMSPDRLVYVSCDPATLARDVALLAYKGYTLKKAHAYDLFPRCAHVETVVLLEKS